MSLWKKICEPSGANANVLIRLVVGGVFLNEGILKFLYPVAQAAGRFAKIGIPYPDLFGPFVATVETVCGAMVILGLLSRPAAIALSAASTPQRHRQPGTHVPAAGADELIPVAHAGRHHRGRAQSSASGRSSPTSILSARSPIRTESECLGPRHP